MKLFYLIFLIGVSLKIRQVNCIVALSAVIQGSDPYEEGTNVEIILTAGTFPDTCTISTANPDYAPVGTNPISLAGGEIKTATVSLISGDQTEGSESVPVTLTCTSAGESVFNIQVTEPSSGNGDPHFMLLVQDQNNNRGPNKHICFDVTSTKANRIHIFQDSKQNISIYGLLKDDYYMHEIQFHINGQYFQIRPKHIFWQSANVGEWNDQSFKSILKHKDISLNIQNDLLYVKVARSEHSLREHSFFVKKSMNPTIGVYLDIFINDLHSYKSAGGLLGYAMNHTYKFFPSSQKSGRMALKINDNIFPSEITSRGNIDCWLLNVNHVLYPKSLDDFISNF